MSAPCLDCLREQCHYDGAAGAAEWDVFAFHHCLAETNATTGVGIFNRNRAFISGILSNIDDAARSAMTTSC